MKNGKDTIILPDWLITSGLEKPKYKWGVRISGNTISQAAPHDILLANAESADIFHAPDKVLSPGFVNTHTHMYGVLAHGIPMHKAPTGFWSFLTDFWWPLIEDRLDQQMICAATDLRCANMLNSGVTTFYDCTEAPNALPGCLEEQASVVQKHQIRAILSFEATERVSKENGQLGLQENVNLIKQLRAGISAEQDTLISGLMCHHTTFTCSAAFIQQVFSLASQYQVLLHAHVSEGTYEPEYALEHFGKRTLEYYNELGIASERFLASQCVQISDDEVELINSKGVRVSHMPLSNCEVGGGIAPIPQLINRNVNLGLGSDGYIDDFFEIMRGAFLIHKAFHLDPQVMPAHLVWHLATEGGARALGYNRIGRIAEGWLADLQLIDGRLPTPIEEHNLFEQLLLYRNASHVNTVWVNGKVRVSDGHVLDTDMERLLARTNEEAKKLWQAAID